MTPSCKPCSGRGWIYKKGDPTRHTCEECKGTGRRPAAAQAKGAPSKLGPRKRAKMMQVASFKMRYLEEAVDPARPDYVDGCLAAPCQVCGFLTPINRAEFSHKVAAGMGGAGDEGGQVSPKNGTYSCACCHAFIEQDREAFNEHQDSPASCDNVLKVEFTAEAAARHSAWRARWFNAGRLV